MKIEKIKNYNQRMLAVLITVVVITAVIGLISLLVFIISDMIPNSSTDNNALLSDDKIEELKKDSLRQQIISYDSPRLVDTLNLIYILPVHVKTLEKAEDMGEGVLGLLDGDFEIGSRKSTFKRRSYYYGSFNNLIVYDYKNNQSQKVSEYRLYGSDLTFHYFDDEILLVFTGAEKDTNKDHKVNDNDFNSLFVYSLKNKELKKISLDKATVVSYEFVENQKDILVNFGYDRNQNQLFESAFEPNFIRKYTYNTSTLELIISEELEVSIQKIIDKN